MLAKLLVGGCSILTQPALTGPIYTLQRRSTTPGSWDGLPKFHIPGKERTPPIARYTRVPSRSRLTNDKRLVGDEPSTVVVGLAGGSRMYYVLYVHM